MRERVLEKLLYVPSRISYNFGERKGTRRWKVGKKRVEEGRRGEEKNAERKREVMGACGRATACGPRRNRWFSKWPVMRGIQIERVRAIWINTRVYREVRGYLAFEPVAWLPIVLWTRSGFVICAPLGLVFTYVKAKRDQLLAPDTDRMRPLTNKRWILLHVCESARW